MYCDVAYWPYDESYAASGSGDLNFTGQNQDTVSGLYDFLYREYNPSQGRWPSPDPAGMAAASIGNPQTWNRYAYVGNSPCSTVDPLGLEDCTLNINLRTNGYLTNPEAADARSRIASLLAQAGVGAAFNQAQCRLHNRCRSHRR